jgi:hypothetical protein
LIEWKSVGDNWFGYLALDKVKGVYYCNLGLDYSGQSHASEDWSNP